MATGRRGSDVVGLAAPLPRWHHHHQQQQQSSRSPSPAPRWSLPTLTTPRRLLRRHPLLPILLTLLALSLLPLLRRAYITYSPHRPLTSRRDPHWWLDPWTLPPDRFPKITLYPDVDWNPSPVRFASGIRELEKREGPWSVRCDDEGHPWREGHGGAEGSGAGASSPLLYMGIFTTAKKREVRDVIRTTMLPRYDDAPKVNSSHPWHPHGTMSIPPHLLEVHFILAYPRRWSHTIAMLNDGTLTLPQPLPRENLDDYITPSVAHPSPSRFAPWPGNGLAWWRKLVWPVVGWTRWEKREARWQVEMMRGLAEENALWGGGNGGGGHGGLVMLPVEEAMNSGKTYHFFRWVARTRRNVVEQGGGSSNSAASSSSPTPRRPPPRFVMKTDDDTFHVLPNLLSAFSSLSCSTPSYLGTSWGCSQHFPYHFGGLGYALSWPLVVWLGDDDDEPGGRRPLPWYHTNGNEDARLGSYLVSLRRAEQPVVTVDYSVRMGSYFDDVTFPKDTSTLALHYLKKPDVYRRQAERMWRIWEREGRVWRWVGAEEWVNGHGQLHRG